MITHRIAAVRRSCSPYGPGPSRLYLCDSVTIIPEVNRRISDQDYSIIVFDTLLHKPRNSGRLAALMELYERNYVLVRLLIPELRQLGEGVHVSQPEGAMPLELSAIEHSRFTSTFNLSYRFSSDQGARERHGQVGRRQREPDLTIRIYHDARTCEVMSGLIPSFTRESRRVRDLQHGHHLNRFLDKWLNYCLRQGHSFAGGAGMAPDQGAVDNGEGATPRTVQLTDPLSG